MARRGLVWRSASENPDGVILALVSWPDGGPSRRLVVGMGVYMCDFVAGGWYHAGTFEPVPGVVWWVPIDEVRATLPDGGWLP